MMKIMTRLSMKSMPNRYTRREAVYSGRRCATRATSPTALAMGFMVVTRFAGQCSPIHVAGMFPPSTWTAYS